jgi:hypothetical protein
MLDVITDNLLSYIRGCAPFTRAFTLDLLRFGLVGRIPDPKAAFSIAPLSADICSHRYDNVGHSLPQPNPPPGCVRKVQAKVKMC